jgi:hypothetical protein
LINNYLLLFLRECLDLGAIGENEGVESHLTPSVVAMAE